jgi:hypothetical protein
VDAVGIKEEGIMSQPVFYEVLESIEGLNIEQTEVLLDIVTRRLQERKREVFLERVAVSQAEYERGDVIRGDAAAIMKAALE